jgi:hypothetical protein
MAEEAKMRKAIQFKCGVTMEARHKFGMSFILIKQEDLKLRDLTRTSVSM